MSRYIDADAVIEAIQKCDYSYHEYGGGWKYIGEYDKKMIIDTINKQPIADVVEVIRCKDCKYQDKGENVCESWNLCEHSWLHIPIDDEHFCADGERREDERTD